MKNFETYLQLTKEVGTVTQANGSIIQVIGLPEAHPGEVILAETGEMGLVLSLLAETVEILVLSAEQIGIGTKVTRTQTGLKIKVGEDLLGKLHRLKSGEDFFFIDESEETRLIEGPTKPFAERRRVEKPLETGVSIVDLIVPLGKGQRQLIIGDRKSGKTNFLLQVIRRQAQSGCICIYVAVAKPQQEISRLSGLLKDPEIGSNLIMVATSSADRAGLIYLTPYVGMTMAEYFRDQGKDVVVIFDDLTAHAKYYREIMLLARRFPGRSSYPGDVFYIHARLLERAGNFDKGSISCLPAAQSVLGDLSGYIQSNIMSMTDGHIFFDSDLFDQGQRPAISPFLSVTRVGEQTQTPLVREVSRHLRSFLVSFEKMKQFKHFQTELNENIRSTFEKGQQIMIFLDQLPDQIVPITLNIVLYGALWADFWDGIAPTALKKEILTLIEQYKVNIQFQAQVNELVQSSPTLNDLMAKIKQQPAFLLEQVRNLRT